MSSAISRQSAFTLIELLIAMSIVAIFAAFALPSFNGTIARTRTKSVASELYASLSKTRSEALVRNTTVQVSAKTGGWQAGWTIDIPGSGAAPMDDRGPTTGLTVSGPTTVSYAPTGRLASTAAAPIFIISAPASSDATACVSVDLSGRPYLKMASTC